jgi:outer membrane receptor protein involved in Fe transport
VLTGTRFPGTKEQFILQDLGTSKYVGGLKEMFTQFDLPGNAFYQQDVDAFNLAVENDVYHEDNPIGQTQAILKNMSLLEDGIVQEEQFDGLRPEKVISFELGYKNKIQNSLFFDVIYYRSMYRDFIGFVRVAKPRTSPQIDLFTSAGQVNNSSQRDQILVYRNSGQNVTIQGVALGGKWITPLGGVLAFNATWSDINQVEEDPIVPGFNTPKFKFNLSIANRKMDNMENNPGMKNVGIHINWRYQSAIDWESPFASGRVDPFATTDFQISYNFRRTNAILKAGVSNFLNIKHTSSFGGAQVGIFYYTSFSIDIY